MFALCYALVWLILPISILSTKRGDIRRALPGTLVIAAGAMLAVSLASIRGDIGQTSATLVVPPRRIIELGLLLLGASGIGLILSTAPMQRTRSLALSGTLLCHFAIGLVILTGFSVALADRLVPPFAVPPAALHALNTLANLALLAGLGSLLLAIPAGLFARRN